MITIVDYSLNNLRSVQKAFEHLGFPTRVTSEPGEIARAQKLVLPGVGAFGTAMKNLRERELVEPLIDAATAGTPLLGVCLAMQLLFDWSEELGLHAGLGLLPGKVEKLPSAPDWKIPNIGWCPLHLPRAGRLLRGIEPNDSVYFVHSYHVRPDEADCIAATSQHGTTFVAAIERDNVMACQFHPEKSSAVGLKILQNFAAI